MQKSLRQNRLMDSDRIGEEYEKGVSPNWCPFTVAWLLDQDDPVKALFELHDDED